MGARPAVTPADLYAFSHGAKHGECPLQAGYFGSDVLSDPGLAVRQRVLAAIQGRSSTSSASPDAHGWKKSAWIWVPWTRRAGSVQGSSGGLVEPVGPFGLGEDFLDQDSVGVGQGGLKQV